MTDILLPPWLNIARTTFTPIENTGISRSPFGGPTRTASLGGDRMGLSLEWTATGGATEQQARRALIAFLVRSGRRNRVNLTDPAHTVNGSFPAVELLANNTFANGTSSWGVAGSPANLSVSDRIMRVTRTSSGANPQISQQVTVTQYAPYVCRAMLLNGKGSQSLFTYLEQGSSTTQTAGPGLASTAAVSFGTTFRAVAYDGISTGGLAGDYFEVPYTSLARCALVDAGVNLITRSDEFNDASWTKTNSSAGTNALTAPDGSTTADTLIDTASAALHAFDKSFSIGSGPVDLAFSVAVKAQNRGFCSLQLSDGSTTALQCFNLITGAVGASGSTGASWSARRAFVCALGDNWYMLTLVVRKTGAATSVNAAIFAASSDGGETYAGSSNAAIGVWRATLSQSGVASRLAQSNSSSAPNGEIQLGSGIRLKGLPASTNNLLLPGALVEIIAGAGSELKILTAPLHSDAAGLGYLQFEPAIRVSPVDNAAVIIHQPFGRFIFSGQVPSWSNEPGVITTASAEFEEA